jgi:hypothetical protein
MRTLPLVVVSLCLCACPKKEEAAAPAAPAPAPVKKDRPAEVEFFGSVKPGALKPAKLVFVAQAEPCTPVPAEVHLIGKTELTAERLFAEYWPAQGTKGHVCAFGLDDKGQIIGAAGDARSPFTFQGDGEIIVDQIALELKALDAPVAAPKGF